MFFTIKLSLEEAVSSVREEKVSEKQSLLCSAAPERLNIEIQGSHLLKIPELIWEIQSSEVITVS